MPIKLVISLAILAICLVIRVLMWLWNAVLGSTSNHAHSPGQLAYAGYGVFDVLIYQTSPYGVGAWTHCRRHSDYHSTLRDVESLRAYGYTATFVQR